MTWEEARGALAELQRKLSAYNHAISLLYYDGVTTAPKATAANRAQSTAVLSEEQYRLSTGPETVELLTYLDADRDRLDKQERRQVELLLREIRKLQKIPLEEYSAFERLVVESDDVWRTAKERSDFPLFEPYLEKIVETRRRFARYCAPERDPYDYWLNEFEEGLNRARCDAFFAVLRARIVPLVRRIQERPQLDRSILRGHFPAEGQLRLARRLMDWMGLEETRVGLALTEHPFTISLGSHWDERITTHIDETDFSASLFSVIHESGHALYDTGSDKELAYTVLDGGVSMGIHESQSRFYENLLGRSRAFCRCLFPLLREIFPEQMRGFSAEDLYRAVNRVEPSLIRIEADELTYSLHIMVRYELEKRLMDGTLAVHDLPAAWNGLYREMLGVEVPDDRRGVLQDSHWAGGSIGYFPSYAFGNAYGAQFLRRMRDCVDIEDCLESGDFAPINSWNLGRIWRWGSLYRPAEVFENAAGEPFDPTVYTDYLEEKFSELYGLQR